jgi:cyclase
MAIARRVIPSLLIRGRSLVKGQSFNSWRSVGAAVQAVKVFEFRQVDELLILDIAATPEGRGPNSALIEEMARECFMPLTVGGGVRTLEDIRALLCAGADKVAVCTAAVERPELIAEAAEKFGSQCVTVSIDVLHGKVATHCGKRITDLDPVEWASRVAELGAGEILLNSVERDGTLSGHRIGWSEGLRRHARGARGGGARGCRRRNLAIHGRDARNG